MNRFMTLSLHASALALATSAVAAPPDSSWPHWRGPNHDAVSREGGWSVTGRDEPLWSLNVGLGYSCVAIDAGRLFTLGFHEEEGLDRLLCLDPTTGEELWRTEWSGEVLANFHGGGTLTTPSIDGDLLYLSSRFGMGRCVRADTGEVVWTRDYAKELSLEPTFHGFSASPLVLEDRMILVFGDVVACCEKETGDVRWRAGETGGDGGYSNPVPFELDGRPLIAVYDGTGLVVYDRDDGASVWSYAWKPKGGGVNCCTPIVLGDRVFVSSAYDLGSVMLRLGADPTPELVWDNRQFRNKVSSCVLWDDHIYGFDESMLKCLDLDGNEMWRVRGLGLGTPAIADGKLLVLSSKGHLLIAEATPDGFDELVRRKVLDGGVYWTPPVLLGGLIYVRNSLGDLACLDHRGDAGSPTAAAPMTDEPEPSPLPPATALFERHAALIGADALRTRTAMRVTGEFETLSDGITRCPMTIERAAPDRWHLEYSLGKYGKVERGYDGDVAWVVDPFYGNEVLSGDRLREVQELIAFHHEADWRDAYPEMKTVGRTRFADRECIEVSAVTARGTQRRVYFDARTGHKVGHVADSEALTVYSDWRDFDGVLLPARTTRLITDTGVEETTLVTEVSWGPVDDHAFDRPDVIRKLLRTPEEIEADAARLHARFGSHLGSFRADFPPYDGSAWTILIENGELKYSTELEPPNAIAEPDENGRSPLPYPGMFLDFIADENGAIDRLRLTARGEEHVLPRIP